MESTVGLVLACLFGYVIGLRRSKTRYQNRGELAVQEILKTAFGARDAHVLNHVTLPTRTGSAQIDHILVTPFGVFVVETKDYRGWIFANARDQKWTQVLFRKKFRFQNPLLQNFGHVAAVRELLDFLPANAIHSVVVFAGDAEFKTERPAAVVTLEGLVDYIESFNEKIISLNRMQFCVGRIEMARLAISGQTDVEHAQRVQSRYGRME